MTVSRRMDGANAAAGASAIVPEGSLDGVLSGRSLMGAIALLLS
jgi:hypothetical protein